MSNVIALGVAQHNAPEISGRLVKVTIEELIFCSYYDKNPYEEETTNSNLSKSNLSANAVGVGYFNFLLDNGITESPESYKQYLQSLSEEDPSQGAVA